MGQDSAWRRGDSFCFRLREKRRKRKRFGIGELGPRIRECQGIGAGTPWGLFALEKRCFEAAPCRGLARRLRCGSGTCRPMGFLANFGARRFPKGNEGKTQGGLPLGNPVCLWQTELFKLNLKSSPSSSGYNRRRRLATGRSGKQQAERTAVRTAPIVCPEESLLGARRRNPPFPDEGLTRRLRRGSRACSPMGRSHFSFGGERKVCKRKPAARRLREKGFYCPF